MSRSNQQVRRGICSTIPICKFYSRRASTRLTSRARDRRMRLAFPQVCARLSHMHALTTRTFYPQVCDAMAQRHKHGANSGPRSPPGMSGGSRLTPGGEQVMERARRPPSSRGRRSRRVSAAPLLEGAAEELLHALVRARARD